MIAVVEIIKAVHGKEAELKKALHGLVPISRKAEGCLLYELFEPSKGNGEFLVFQKWKDKADLTRHENANYNEEFVKKYEGILYTEVTHYTEWKPVV